MTPDQLTSVNLVCILDNDGKKCSQSVKPDCKNEITLLVDGLRQWLGENKANRYGFSEHFPKAFRSSVL